MMHEEDSSRDDDRHDREAERRRRRRRGLLRLRIEKHEARQALAGVDRRKHERVAGKRLDLEVEPIFGRGHGAFARDRVLADVHDERDGRFQVDHLRNEIGRETEGLQIRRRCPV